MPYTDDELDQLIAGQGSPTGGFDPLDSSPFASGKGFFEDVVQPKKWMDYLIQKPAEWMGFDPKGQSSGQMLSEAAYPKGPNESTLWDKLLTPSQFSSLSPQAQEYVKGAIRPLVGGGVDFLTDPANALIPGEGAVGKMATGLFGSQMVKGASESAGRLYSDVVDQGKGLTPETFEEGVQTALDAGVAALAGRHALKGGMELAPPPKDLGLPSTQELSGSPKGKSNQPGFVDNGPEYVGDVVKSAHELVKKGLSEGQKVQRVGGVEIVDTPEGGKAISYTSKDGTPKAGAIIAPDGTVTDIAGTSKLASGKVALALKAMPEVKVPGTEAQSADTVALLSKERGVKSPEQAAIDEPVRALFMAGDGSPATPVEHIINDYLKKVPLSPGDTSRHQPLMRMVEEHGVAGVAEKIGLKPEQLMDALNAPSEVGRQLQSLKEMSAFTKMIDEASKDPKVQAALASLSQGTKAVQPTFDLLSRSARALHQGERNLKAFYQASLAGTLGVSGQNLLNGGGMVGLSAIQDMMLAGAGHALGREAWVEQYGGRQYAKNLGKSIAGLYSDTIQTVLKGEANPSAKQISSLKDLMQSVSPEHAEKLYHQHSSELNVASSMDEVRKRPLMEKVTHALLAPNLTQDYLLRSAILQTELSNFAKKHETVISQMPGDNIYEKMQAYSKVSKPFREALQKELGYSTTEALRSTGGLQSPQGSITRGIVETWSKIPGAWIIQPFLNFGLSNFLPNIIDHVPLLPLLSEKTRSGRSIRLEGLEESAKAYKEIYKKASTDPTIKGDKAKAGLVARKNYKALTRKLDLYREEGVYRPEKVYVRQATGLMLMAMAATWRYMRGDDGTEYNEVPAGNSDNANGKKVINITGAQGSFAPFMLLGDYIGHKVIGSGKYDTPEGKFQWERMLDSLNLSSKAAPGPIETVLKGEGDEDSLTKVGNRVASEFLKGLSSGAWMGESTRALASHFDQEENTKRRTDLSPLSGVQANVPFLRQSLPPQIDKTTGSPASSDQLDKISGDPTASAFGRGLGNIIPGTRKDVSPIAQFLSDNKGWIEGSQVLFKNSSDPEYDALVGKFSKEKFESTVVPWLQNEAKDLPREARVQAFTEMMQKIREDSHNQAIAEYVMDGKKLPNEIVKPLEKAARKESLGEMYPMPEVETSGERPSPEEILDSQGVDPYKGL